MDRHFYVTLGDKICKNTFIFHNGCTGFISNGTYKLIYLNVWSFVNSATWQRLGCEVLLE